MDRMQFLDGIQVLLSFSLVKIVNHLYSMHILVSAWSRCCIPKSEVEDYCDRARALLSCSIVVDWNVDNYEFCRILAPHIRSNCLDGLELKLNSKYYDDEYEGFALVFHHIGSWDEQEKMLHVMVHQRTTKLGSDHSDTLTSISNLALTYRNQGRWNEAEKLEMDVMNASKAKLGSDHPYTLTSMANLASTYRGQGRWDEAVKLEMDVMNARQTKLESDNLDAVTNMSNLETVCRDEGRLNGAETLDLGDLDVINAKTMNPESGHLDATLTSIANQLQASNQVLQTVQQDHNQPEHMVN